MYYSSTTWVANEILRMKVEEEEEKPSYSRKENMQPGLHNLTLISSTIILVDFDKEYKFKARLHILLVHAFSALRYDFKTLQCCQTM